MSRLLRAFYVFQIHVAVRIGALGDFWAGHAARRLGILSENFPGIPTNNLRQEIKND